MTIPADIAKHIGDLHGEMDDVGCSGAQVILYRNKVLKIEPESNSAANEHRMMRWLQGKLLVPQIIGEAFEENTRYLLMSRIQGDYLCKEEILDDQHLLAEMAAEGLRKLWSVDISTCPTDRSLDAKFHEIEAGIRGGTITMDNARQEETYGPGGFKSPSQLFDWLIQHRSDEELVLSHGDYCLPNIFCKDRQVSGFIDLGCSGIADKWVDIEMVLWSMWANTTGKFGGRSRPFDRRLLFDALELQPDEEKLRYYSLLSELC